MDVIDPLHTEQSAAMARSEGMDPAKRRQILQGARAMFLERGFEGASMGEIARRAGVSKGTLYVYFENKEQLFAAIMDEERSAHLAVLTQFDMAAPPEQVLRTFGQRLLTLISEPAKIAAMRTAISIAERMPDVGRTFYERGPARTIGALSGYLKQKVGEGVLAIEDTTLAASQFLDLCQTTIVRPCLFGVELSPQEAEARIARVVDSAVRVFLSAYGVR